MQKITISIEEINNNPNLDISERLAKLKTKYKDKYSEDDLKSLAIASIKQEYELFANNRINFTKEADDLLEKIKNGGELSDRDAFILNCDDPQKISEYSKFDDIKNRIQDNNAITIDDFNFLCEAMRLEPYTKRLLEIGYKSKGLISNYSQSVGKLSLDDFEYLCSSIKMDDDIKAVLLATFKNKGLISEFKPENSEKYHR